MHVCIDTSKSSVYPKCTLCIMAAMLIPKPVFKWIKITYGLAVRCPYVYGGVCVCVFFASAAVSAAGRSLHLYVKCMLINYIIPFTEILFTACCVRLVSHRHSFQFLDALCAMSAVHFATQTHVCTHSHTEMLSVQSIRLVVRTTA